MATTQYHLRLTGEEREVEAWAAARNATVTPILWTFSLADARTRLAYAYTSRAGEEDMMPWTRYRAGVSSTDYRVPPPTPPSSLSSRAQVRSTPIDSRYQNLLVILGAGAAAPAFDSRYQRSLVILSAGAKHRSRRISCARDTHAGRQEILRLRTRRVLRSG